MNHRQLIELLNREMPHRLNLHVHQCTPLYRQLKGDPLRWQPSIQEVRDGYGIAFFDIHETYSTRDEAMQAGLRILAKYEYSNLA